MHTYKVVNHSNLQSFYEDVLSNGEDIQPREMPCRAILNTAFTFVPGTTYFRPGLNNRIGYVEALQLIAGTFNIGSFEKVAPNARLDLFSLQSAYGPRIASQLDRVVWELDKDRQSRRAVVYVGHHTDVSEQLPCTTSIQFQISDDILFTTVSMRSSDLIWGLPTDIIQFGALAQMIGNVTKSNPVLCTVLSANSHVYKASAMKGGELYSPSKKFAIPRLNTLQEYRLWGEYSDALVREGVPLSDIFQFHGGSNDRNI
jgi:hypothetical protein